MVLYRGGCSCGELRYHISCEPIFTQACHCRLCQRQTASAFIVRTMIETSNFHVDSGDLIHVHGPTGSGRGQEVYRCATCKVHIYSTFNNSDAMTFIKTATFDEPEHFPPQAHIFTRSKLGWVNLDGGTPCFEEYYNKEEMLSAESLARREAIGW